MEYYVVVNGQRQGPFLLEQLRASGIRPDALIWRPGFENWVRADQVPAITDEMNWRSAYIMTALPAMAGPPPSTIEERPAWGPDPRFSLARTSWQPWNPVLIACLGIAFSPVWAGVMAALNARRLQLGMPWWRPIVIGVGALFLDIIAGMFFEAYLVDLLLYGGALALIWFIDLMP